MSSRTLPADEYRTSDEPPTFSGVTTVWRLVARTCERIRLADCQ